MNDLINRKSTIDALEKEKPTPFVNKDGSIDLFGAGRQNQWYRDGIAIMNLPSAQSEQKKGKWIKISPAGIYECSVCSQNIMTQNIDVYNYCHGCGIKMEVNE